jgi:hypothetical protein
MFSKKKKKKKNSIAYGIVLWEIGGGKYVTRTWEDIDAEDNKSDTACQIAQNQGYDEVAQYLVEQCAKNKT